MWCDICFQSIIVVVVVVVVVNVYTIAGANATADISVPFDVYARV